MPLLLGSEETKRLPIQASASEVRHQLLEPRRVASSSVKSNECGVEKITKKVRFDVEAVSARDSHKRLMTVVSIEEGNGERKGTLRLKLRIQKSEYERRLKECQDEDDLGGRIMKSLLVVA